MYKSKYFKYKRKYLELKKLIGSGLFNFKSIPDGNLINKKIKLNSNTIVIFNSSNIIINNKSYPIQVTSNEYDVDIDIDIISVKKKNNKIKIKFMATVIDFGIEKIKSEYIEYNEIEKMITDLKKKK